MSMVLMVSPSPEAIVVLRDFSALSLPRAYRLSFCLWEASLGHPVWLGLCSNVWRGSVRIIQSSGSDFGGGRNLGSSLLLASTFLQSTAMLMAPLPLLSFSLHTHRRTGSPGSGSSPLEVRRNTSAGLQAHNITTVQGCTPMAVSMRNIRDLKLCRQNNILIGKDTS